MDVVTITHGITTKHGMATAMAVTVSVLSFFETETSKPEEVE